MSNRERMKLTYFLHNGGSKGMVAYYNVIFLFDEPLVLSPSFHKSCAIVYSPKEMKKVYKVLVHKGPVVKEEVTIDDIPHLMNLEPHETEIEDYSEII